ncbi:hypothetical protein [Borreliella garinii]|nr:hypothetical protein [Borreliella garinii]
MKAKMNLVIAVISSVAIISLIISVLSTRNIIFNIYPVVRNL